MTLAPDGLVYRPEFIDGKAQRALREELVALLAEAPFYRPEMPGSGKPLSVVMSNAGPLGWLSDRTGGYRYSPCHPETGRPWPSIPQVVLDLWDAVSGCSQPPEACLINYYRPGARMGLHQDRDEEDLSVPVVSLSLGDTAVFRIARARGGPSTSMRLASGDVLVMAGDARLSYHGIDRVLGGSSRLLGAPLFPQGGRINLTLRRVNRG